MIFLILIIISLTIISSIISLDLPLLGRKKRVLLSIFKRKNIGGDIYLYIIIIPVFLRSHILVIVLYFELHQYLYSSQSLQVCTTHNERPSWLYRYRYFNFCGLMVVAPHHENAYSAHWSIPIVPLN